MLASWAMIEFLERLTELPQWTLGVTTVVIVIVVVATVLYYVRRVGGRGSGSRSTKLTSSKICSADTSTTDSWLLTVMEWAWLRGHVTWRHLVTSGVNAWMTALTEQANRQSVSAITARLISAGPD